MRDDQADHLVGKNAGHDVHRGDSRHPRQFAADGLAVVALILMNLILYRKVLRLWWTYDDANTLRLIFDSRFVDAFVSSKVWPQQLFTPLLMVTFRAQLALFGLDPPRWYAMHLAIAAAAIVAVYAAVRQFFEPGTAFAAAAIFAAGVPICSVVTQLSTVHYFVAIILCALATTAQSIALRRSSAVAAVAAVLCYFAAMLAKEVAVPLPLLLVALPLRGARARVRYAIGHCAAAVAYLLWRYAVLGTFLGAYGWKIDAAEWPHLLLLLPVKIIRAAAGSNLPLGLTLLAVMTVVIVLGAWSRRALPLIVVVAIVVLGPMLPLAKEINRRHVVVVWLGWSVAFAAATTGLNRRTAAVLLTAVPLLTVVASRQEWRVVFALSQRMSDEARFFVSDIPTDGLLRQPATPPAAMGELNWLRTIHLGRPSGASWFYDDVFLCANGAAGKRVWEYDHAARAIVEITPKIEGIGRTYCAAIKAKAPLSVAFHYRKPVLYWDLGPYADGRYSAVIGDGLQAFELRRHEALNLPGMTGLTLSIRYDSPSGWITYSPNLTLDFTHRPDTTWRR